MVQYAGFVTFSVSQLGVTETHDHEMVQSFMTFALCFLYESHHLTYVKSWTPA
jgi:hypothetical protein